MAAVGASTPPNPFPKIPAAASSLSRQFRSQRRHLANPTPRPQKPLMTLDHRIQESLALLDAMESESLAPDPSLLAAVISVAASSSDPNLIAAALRRARRLNLDSHPAVLNSLVIALSNSGRLPAARQLFDEMPMKTVEAHTTAIAIHHRAGRHREALALFAAMKEDPSVPPNAFTFTTALNACSGARDLETGRGIHEEIKRNRFELDGFVMVALIDMYSKCGEVSSAREVFDGVPEPSIEACTAMIEGYTQNGDGKKAMDLVRRTLALMGVEAASGLGFPTVIRVCGIELALRQGQEVHAHIVKFGHKPGMKALFALVDLYEKCDRVMAALRVFDGLVVKNVGLWGRLVSGLVRIGLYDEALKVYHEMRRSDSGFHPLTVCSALEACIGLSRLEEGKQIHGKVLKVWSLLSRDSIISDLAELYHSCGEDENASKLVER